MCFDSDVAGIKAAEKSIEMLWQADINIKVVLMPKDIKDPDELIQKNPQAWVEAVKKQIILWIIFLFKLWKIKI